MTSDRARALVAVAVMAALSALLVSACGGGSDSGTSDTGTSASADTGSTGSASSGGASQAASEKTLERLYEGHYFPPPTNVPPAQRGKNVWFISCGQQFAPCATSATNFEDAAEVLGWNATIYNGNAANPSQNLAGVKQAVAAGADAIITVSQDCPGIKSGLLEAKAAGIPVINYAGLDCDAPEYGQEPLFAATVKVMDGDNIIGWYEERGKAMAEYVVARSQLDGVEAPKTVVIENQDQAGHKAGFETFNASMSELCPDCDVVDEEFAISQVPNPAAANWKSQILANPDADAVVFDTISWIPAGLGAAMKASPNKELLSCCADATNEEGLALIREGTISASLSWPIEYDAWSIADTTNQILAGVDPAKLPPEGGGFQIVDAEHNLPQSGGLPYPVDFRAIRTKAWNAG